MCAVLYKWLMLIKWKQFAIVDVALAVVDLDLAYTFNTFSWLIRV